jgi:hypothetical protein
MHDPDDAEKRRRQRDGSWIHTWPGRPNTPEWRRLSDIVLRLDGAATDPANPTPIEELLGAHTDIESLTYLAQQRAGMFVQRMGLGPLGSAIEPLLVSVYFEAFNVGAEYVKNPPEQGWPTRTAED